MFNPPVAVMCFNRPDYFKKTLDSIKSNQQNGRKIFIFQDKPINAEGDKGYHEVSRIAEEFVVQNPRESIFIKNNVNLGIASQWFRVISFIIDFIGSSAAYIIEDDLVISENYLKSMDDLLELFGGDDRVGVYSCFNPIHREDKAGYSLMGHDWGFCITKKSWDKIKNLYFDYILLQSMRDYRSRDSSVIKDWFESLGFVWRNGFEGADSALEYFLAGNGLARISTNINLAMPIGEVGMHFTPEIFESLFAGVSLDQAIDFRQPTDEEFFNATEWGLLESKELFDMATGSSKEKSGLQIISGVKARTDYSIFNDFLVEFFPDCRYFGIVNSVDSRTIGAGGYVFGPYIRVNPGKYFVCIKIDCIGALKCHFSFGKGANNIFPESSLVFDRNKNEKSFIFCFDVVSGISDLEIIISAIDEIKIQYISLWGHMK